MADFPKDPKAGKKRNALGRGLSALLEDNSSAESQETVTPRTSYTTGASLGSISAVPIDRIETNPFQPRTHFDLVALEELSESIRVQGIIQPIAVRSMGGNRYQLISGERRLQASKMAGLTEIPAFVRTANDEQMLEMALIENIQRQDLNPMEIALGYQRMMDELGLKMDDLGDKVGKKRATVNNYLRLLKLPPEIQIGLRDNQISMGHARALINIEDKEEQLRIYRDAAANDLSVRTVEMMARQAANPAGQKPTEKTATPARKDIHVSALEDRMEEKLGTRVTIQQNATGKGELRISFESTDDLNRLLEIIGF